MATIMILSLLTGINTIASLSLCISLRKLYIKQREEHKLNEDRIKYILNGLSTLTNQLKHLLK